MNQPVYRWDRDERYLVDLTRVTHYRLWKDKTAAPGKRWQLSAYEGNAHLAVLDYAATRAELAELALEAASRVKVARGGSPLPGFEDTGERIVGIFDYPVETVSGTELDADGEGFRSFLRDRLVARAAAKQNELEDELINGTAEPDEDPPARDRRLLGERLLGRMGDQNATDFVHAGDVMRIIREECGI